MRERELKLTKRDMGDNSVSSLPMRERELKLATDIEKCDELLSLPMRERELKREWRKRDVGARQVAPHAGA